MVADLHVVLGHVVVFIVVLAIALKRIVSQYHQHRLFEGVASHRVVRRSWACCGVHCCSSHCDEAYQEHPSRACFLNVRSPWHRTAADEVEREIATLT